MLSLSRYAVTGLLQSFMGHGSLKYLLSLLADNAFAGRIMQVAMVENLFIGIVFPTGGILSLFHTA